MATPTRPSRRESTVATPTQAPSSPQPSESLLSELDGTAPSVLDTTADFQWDAGSSAGPVGLDLVSWRRGSVQAGQAGKENGEEGGVVDDLPTRGFYAISTVIAHPTKRANPLRSTRKPLPPIGHPAPLPKPPPPSHYDAYLQAVTPLYETFLSARTAGDAEGLGGAKSSGNGSADGALTGAFDIKPLDVKSTLPPLEDIPAAFFDSSFDLADPAIWAEITGQGSSASQTADPPPATSSGPGPKSAQYLQESLSSHLDTLERHLIHEITLRSTSFFSALSNLQDLHSESSSCLSRIRQLQDGLKDIGENTAQRGLSIIGKHEDLGVMRATEQGLKELEELEGIMDVTRTFVEADDWQGGLGCLGEIEEWWSRHLPGVAAASGVDVGDGQGGSSIQAATKAPSLTSPSPDTSQTGQFDIALPLSTLQALSPLPQLFSDLRTQIALQIETSLHSYLLTTLSAADVDRHPAGSINGNGTNGDDGLEHVEYDVGRFKQHVRPMVEGLARCAVLDGVEGLWGDVVTLAVREGSRKHLPITQAEEEAEEAAPGTEMRGANLAQALRSMSHPAYLSLTSAMYDSMLLRLRLAKTVGTDLLAVVQSVTVDGGFAPLALAQVQSSAHRAGGADVHAGDESGVGITVTAGTPTSEVVPSIPSRSDARSPFSSRPGSAAPSASTSAHNSAAPSASASARTSFDHPRPEPSRLSSLLPAPGPANNTHAHSHASSRPYGTTGGLAEASLQEVLASACDLANLRASKILGVRGEQHAGLKIGEFVQVYRANWAFVEETEGLGGRVVPSLRGVIAAQARTFLIAYHSHRLTRSAKLVEEEQWTQIDVTALMQHAVQLLIQAATVDPGECFVPPKAINGTAINGHSSSSTVSPSAKTLAVEEATFFVVKATAESLELLSEYLAVVINLELVVTDVMARIIEFLKVVLGAGAMRSAGLKNITAKHLALASQSLSVVVSLIPYIREFIRRHLTPKQAVMLTEFDKLKRDYQEHQNEIHAKLVAIMSDRLAVHCGTLRDIDWEATPDKDGPRAYAELLVKETTTLHKVLSKYLAVNTVENVMREVLAAIVHRLSEEYARIELKSEAAKTRMTQDVTLIAARLTPLSEAGSQMTSLETLVKDKPVPRKTVLGGLLKRKGSAAVAGKQAKGLEEEVQEEDMGDDDEAEVQEVREKQDEGEAEKLEGRVDQPGGEIEEMAGRGEHEDSKVLDGVAATAATEPDASIASPQAAAPSQPSSEESAPMPASEENRPASTPPTPPPAPPSKDLNAEPESTEDAPPPPAKAVSPSPGPIPLATPQPVRKIDTSILTPPPAQISPKSSTSATLPDIPPSIAGATSPAPAPVLGPSATSPPPPSASRTSFSSFAASLRSPPPSNAGVSAGAAGSKPSTPTATGQSAAAAFAAAHIVNSTSAPPPPGSNQSTPTRGPRVSLANRLRGVMTRSGSADAHAQAQAQAQAHPQGQARAQAQASPMKSQQALPELANMPMPAPAPDTEAEKAAEIEKVDASPLPSSDATETAAHEASEAAVDAGGALDKPEAADQSETSTSSADAEVAARGVEMGNRVQDGPGASSAGSPAPQSSTMSETKSGEHPASASKTDSQTAVEQVEHAPADPAIEDTAQAVDPAEVAASAPVDVAETAAAALAEDVDTGALDTPAVTESTDPIPLSAVPGSGSGALGSGDDQMPTREEPGTGTHSGNNSDDGEEGDEGANEAIDERKTGQSPAGKTGAKKNKKKKKGKK